MIKNHLKVAIRNLIKSKGFSFINVTGLAIGMACCVLILLFVQDEFRYDKFHKNVDVLYRITSQLGVGNDGLHVALTQVPLAAALQNDIPDIVAASVFSEGGDIVKYGDDTFFESLSFVAPEFFTMFSFAFLQGDPQTALSDPNSIVITESAAKKFFGKKNGLGQTLEIKDKGAVTVTGIIKDVDHSHMRINLVMQDQYLKKYNVDLENWGTLNYSTYIMLTPESDWRQVEEKINGYLDAKESDNETILHLQPLKDIYLHSDYAYDIRTITGDAQMVYILFIIAVFILVIACINFMNLATARSEKRIRESGLRKVFGAKRVQLVLQFIGEAIFLALTALLLTILLVELALPVCNNLFQKELSFEPLSNPNIAFGLLMLSILAGLLAGSYPALVFSASQPLAALQRTLSGGIGSGRLRKALVVGQFACSIMLIISTMVVYQQLRHFQDSALGYNKENLVVIRNRDISNNFDAYKNQLLTNPNVLMVTASSNVPTWSWPGSSISDWEGNDSEKEFMMNSLTVNYDYFETYGIKIATGREFSRDFPADSSGALIINEEAVKQMGLEDPLSKQMAMSNYEGNIIGVVKNFHFDNLRNDVKPLVIKLDEGQADYAAIRIATTDIDATMDFLQETGEAFATNYPVSYRFLDEALENLYRLERTIGKATLYFSVLAIIVASLGLFGLASFSIERRTREIGVRKVLGASVPNIVILLSREFTRLVVISFFIAAPIAYLGLETWLQRFASRTEVGTDVFILAGIITLFITYLTVGYQSIKAALANPAEALRSE